MTKWMPIGDGFIEADVIRWTEPVYRDGMSGKSVPVGERLVIAEVLDADRDGWTHLLVRASEALSPRSGWSVSDVTLPAKDSETKRQRRTIARGHPERLAWSDESARALVASRFLNGRDETEHIPTSRPRPSRPSGQSHTGKRKRKSRARGSGWVAPRP